MTTRYLIIIFIASLIFSCGSNQKTLQSQGNGLEINKLTFVDEVIVPSDFTFENTTVGGLSGIDYANGEWYIISDDRRNPRFYTAQIGLTKEGFEAPVITKVTHLKSKNEQEFSNGQADPESLRVTKSTEIIWSSEGNISQGIDPFIRKASLDGAYTSDITVPNRYLVQEDKTRGPINNGVFEALAQNYNGSGYWTATELPLQEDGVIPTSTTASSPIRIAYISDATGIFKKEYAYQLDNVARKGDLEINGVTEILSYNENSLLVLERSYATGYDDGGNDIKIYKVNTSQATDVSDINGLKSTEYIAATKTLLLDFGTIRNTLPSGLVDNIEGMTFGPDFENGNKSFIVVSDNNFNSFGKQITQLILFEIE